MAIGTRLFSARQLFGATLTLYLLGFLLMVSVWDKGVDNDVTNRDFSRRTADSEEYDDAGAVDLSQERSMNKTLQSKTDALKIQQSTLIPKTKWEALQEQRRSQLQQACRKLANRPPFDQSNITDITRTNKRLLWPFIVNDKHKLLYCYISKVGSTHWKMAFLVLQGKYKTVEDVPGSRAHDPSLKKLSSYKTVEDIAERLDNYTTFIFVRDPFARVISGYRSKLLQNNKQYHKTIGKLIVKRYRKNPTKESLEGGHDVTFPEFVKFLTDAKTKNLDGHFKPMFQMVLPCSVHFDYIGKLETAEEDATYILQNTHVDHLIHFKQTQRNVSHDQATFDRYFSDVPRQDVKRLYEMYYPDFVLFGYELPDYMKSWVR